MTLLEVMVAMMVLAFGIAAVLGAISACLRTSEAAAGYSRGALLAQQVAAEFERQTVLDPGDDAGVFDDRATGYAWTAEIAPVNEQGFYPVHIRVTWQNETRHYDLYLLLNPRPIPSMALPEPVQQPNLPSDSGGAP